ncbi:MAG TPA: hypothetical protein DEH78_05605 [Solibacterales bacterium]|nr:hypothetical protein [Bryobacterales bacterium]
MKRFDSVIGWGIVVLGMVHCAVTFQAYKSATDAALWFFTGGLALIYGGLLNLLRAEYRRPGIRYASLFANLSLLAFAVVYAGRNPMRALHDPAAWFLFALLGLATFFSLRR